MLRTATVDDEPGSAVLVGHSYGGIITALADAEPEKVKALIYLDTLPFSDDRARPHPLATLMQVSRFTASRSMSGTPPTTSYATGPTSSSDSSLTCDRALVACGTTVGVTG